MINARITHATSIGRHATRSALLALVLCSAGAAEAQGGPPPAVRETVQALVAAFESPDTAAIAGFVAARVAPAYRARA